MVLAPEEWGVKLENKTIVPALTQISNFLLSLTLIPRSFDFSCHTCSLAFLILLRLVGSILKAPFFKLVSVRANHIDK